MFSQTLYIAIFFLIFLNFTFLGSQWPWIRANLLHIKDIPEPLVTDEDNGARTAAFFCFAAIFIAMGLWLTISGKDAENARAPDAKNSVADLEVEKCRAKNAGS
ncbi:hypothetical protein H2200_000884 [Cladophialophora chaetospira]|uniref:Uncharacterized protein n=1 Tax=Cladophialophora chaetospira TaxID=386627 RepID=A0AA38XPB8_9EURO|nr:hypothetical protein H2200_000884 [Cladophialophora chaetospira]